MKSVSLNAEHHGWIAIALLVLIAGVFLFPPKTLVADVRWAEIPWKHTFIGTRMFEIRGRVWPIRIDALVWIVELTLLVIAFVVNLQWYKHLKTGSESAEEVEQADLHSDANSAST